MSSLTGKKGKQKAKAQGSTKKKRGKKESEPKPAVPRTRRKGEKKAGEKRDVAHWGQTREKAERKVFLDGTFSFIL